MTRVAKTTQPQRLPRPGTPRSMATLWADMAGDPTESPPVAMQVLARLNGVVNTLAKTGARRSFDVRFGSLSGAPAATDLAGRRVGITAEPLRAGESVLGTRLSRYGVVTGLAIHEAGHGLISEPHSHAVKTRIEFYASHRRVNTYGPYKARERAEKNNVLHVRWVRHGHHLSNLLDDVELEAYWERELPAYGPLFDLVNWYLYAKDIQSESPKAMRVYDRMPRTEDEGWALAVAAVRYADQCQFVGADVLAEVKWWQAWARRGTKVPAGFTVTSPPQHLRGIQAALERFAEYVAAAPPVPEPEPQPEPQPEPPVTDGGFGLDGDEGEDNEDEGEDNDEDGEGEGLSRRRESDDTDAADGDPDDESGEPDEPGTDPCTCGCRAAVAHAYVPIQPTCTDPGCECHGGSDMTGGQDGWEPVTDGDIDIGEDGKEADPNGEDDDDDDDLDGEDGEGDEEDGAAGDGDEDLDGEDSGEEPGDEPGEGESGEGDEEDADVGGGKGSTPHTNPDNVDGYENPLESHVETNEADADLAREVDPFIEAVRNGRREIKVTFDSGSCEQVVIDPVKRNEAYHVDVPQDLVNALTTAYKTARRSEHPSPARSGRLASRRLARLWTDETPRVFHAADESGGNDPLAIHLLIDASSSMNSTKMGAAKQVVAALVQAMQRERHVRFRVWGYSGTRAPGSGENRSPYDYTDDCWLQDAWDSRLGTSLIGGLGAIKGLDSTPTAGAVMATGLVARDEAQPKDRTLIVVLTDGAPNRKSGDGLPGVVDKVRRMGIDVVALGIGPVPPQSKYFGADAWIPWSQDWTTLGTTLAGLLGKYLIK